MLSAQFQRKGQHPPLLSPTCGAGPDLARCASRAERKPYRAEWGAMASPLAALPRPNTTLWHRRTVQAGRDRRRPPWGKYSAGGAVQQQYKLEQYAHLHAVLLPLADGVQLAAEVQVVLQRHRPLGGACGRRGKTRGFEGRGHRGRRGKAHGFEGRAHPRTPCLASSGRVASHHGRLRHSSRPNAAAPLPQTSRSCATPSSHLSRRRASAWC